MIKKIREILFRGGRLIYGHRLASLLLLTLLILLPAIAFSIEIGHLMQHHKHSASWFAVLLIALLLTIFDVIFLFLTSRRDPGIVPRNSTPPNDLQADSIIDVNNCPPSSKLEWIIDDRTSSSSPLNPQLKDGIVTRHKLEAKYCDTCLLFQPPRTYHCSRCDVCVQRFDHHCKWIGQCIGIRNYRFYCMFVLISTMLCIYIFVVSWIKIAVRYESVLEGISRDILSDILIIYCFVAVWFGGSLSVLHFYLITTNQTSYENFVHHDRKDNPYNKGITENFKEVFFAKTHHQ